jgi:K+-transporting ATPase ATPase C chain
MTIENKTKLNIRPIIGLAIVSLLVCGVIFPLFITGLAQTLFPYQANGEITQFNGQSAGSDLISQNFTSPKFFYPRNDSASGLDPHITIEDAYSQIPRISQATGLSEGTIARIVDKSQEGTLWIFGAPYVNVLHINLELIEEHQSTYSEFLG